MRKLENRSKIEQLYRLCTDKKVANLTDPSTFRRKLKATLFARNACAMSILEKFYLCPCTFRRKLRAALFARNACVMSILEKFNLCPCSCEKSEKREERSFLVNA